MIDADEVMRAGYTMGSNIQNFPIVKCGLLSEITVPDHPY